MVPNIDLHDVKTTVLRGYLVQELKDNCYRFSQLYCIQFCDGSGCGVHLLLGAGLLACYSCALYLELIMNGAIDRNRFEVEKKKFEYQNF